MKKKIISPSRLWSDKFLRAASFFLIFTIFIEKANAGTYGGTGFFVANGGWLITNSHVVEKAKKVTIYLSSGIELPATVVSSDVVNDLALLKSSTDVAPLPIISSETVRLGRSVATIGFPHTEIQGVSPKATEGIISSLAGLKDNPGTFQVSIPIQSGNSGGPLLTREGSVIGVIVAKLNSSKMQAVTGDSVENVSYAIKSSVLLDFLKKEGITPQKPVKSSKILSLEDAIAGVDRSIVRIVADEDPPVPASHAKSAEDKAVSGYTAGQVLTDCDLNCPAMVVIQPGSFVMGSSSAYAYQGPKHLVNISNFFAMSKTEITQGQWRALMGTNPSKFRSCGDDCPVESVTWDQAQTYAHKLSELTGKTYRLPSEAEWEYACKADQPYDYCGGDVVDNIAWVKTNSGGKTHPVGTKKPNAFGLYDMTGNVSEWVIDAWHDNYRDAPVDGSAWRGGQLQRVTRGGGIDGEAAKTIDRGGMLPGDTSTFPGGIGKGVRLVRELP